MGKPTKKGMILSKNVFNTNFNKKMRVKKCKNHS